MGQAVGQAVDARGQGRQPGSSDPMGTGEVMSHLVQQYASQGGKQLKVIPLPMHRHLCTLEAVLIQPHQVLVEPNQEVLTSSEMALTSNMLQWLSRS